MLRSNQDSQAKLFAKNILAGAAAGSINMVLGYPLAFIVTRLEADPGTTKRNREFKGMTDCFRKIYQTEGL